MKNFIAIALLVMASIQGTAQMTFQKPDSWLFSGALSGEPATKDIILSSGVRLEYVEKGNRSGIPVILLHGYTDSWRSYEKVMPLLPDNLHVFAVSQRGHGGSDRPKSGYGTKEFADDISRFMKELKIGPAIIVGHSLGGLVTQQFVLDHPEQVSGMVIISSDPAFKKNPGIPEFIELIRSLGDTLDPVFVEEFQKGTLAKPIDSVYLDTLINESKRVPTYVWKGVIEAIETDFTKRLKEINKPVLILWGDKDMICPRNGQDLFLTRIRNAKLIVYEGTGHALHWEEPKRFAADLVDFIERKIVH